MAQTELSKIIGPVAKGEPSAPAQVVEKPIESKPSVEKVSAPETPSGEKAPEPEIVEPKEPKLVPLTALQDERKKRQEYEKELSAWRAKAEAYEKFAPKVEQPKQPTKEQLEEMFLKDPVGFFQEREKAADQKRTKDRLDMSEMMMRSVAADFDQVLDEFDQAAKSNPALAQQMYSHPHPAKFAYDYGKAIVATKGAGSMEELRASIEKEVRAKIEAEFAGKPTAPASQLAPASLPAPSTVGAPGSGAPSKAFSGPTPLGSIIGPRRKTG